MGKIIILTSLGLIIFANCFSPIKKLVINEYVYFIFLINIHLLSLFLSLFFFMFQHCSPPKWEKAYIEDKIIVYKGFLTNIHLTTIT